MASDDKECGCDVTVPVGAGLQDPDHLARVGRRALRSEYLTIAWNVIEGVTSVAFGVVGSAVSLVAFGLDSFIEVSASAVLVWRLGQSDTSRAELAERRARQTVGVLFFALGAYVMAEALLDLVHREPPTQTLPGIIIAAISAVAMPVLGRIKRRLAGQLGMSSLASESAQTSICGYLSLILLASLLLYRAFGWWWADGVGALAMVPIIIWEGVESFRGKACECH